MPFTQQTFGAFPINYFELPTIVANTMPGTSLSNKIQAANDALGANFGEILIYEGGNIDSDIVLNPRRRLRFFNGDYNFINRKKIYYGDYTHFWGESHEAILHESDVPRTADGGTVQDYFMLVNKNAQTPTAALSTPYSTNTAAPAVRNAVTYGINIEGLQFKGKRGNLTDATTALIGMWNVHNSSIHDCYFNGVTGYLCQVGAESGNTTTARSIGKEYAKGFRFYNNETENCASQQIAAHNMDSLFVYGNNFKNPGKYPIPIVSIAGNPAVVTLAEAGDFWSGKEFVIQNAKRADGTASTQINKLWRIGTARSPTSFELTLPSSTTTVDAATLGGYTANSGIASSTGANFTSIIDLESNGVGLDQQVVMFHIVNNIFDCRGLTVPANLISINTPLGSPCQGGLIAHNTAFGAETGAGFLADGISVAYLGASAATNSGEDITIHDNYMQNMTGKGLFLMGERIHAHHNVIKNGGQNVVAQIQCTNLKNSKITDNTIENPGGHRSNLDLFGDCSNNKILRNNVGGKNNANGLSAIRHGRMEGGVFAANTGAVTNCLFKDNILDGSADSYILETANSNNNLYDGNLTGAAGQKLVIVGAGSKVITHKLLDGKMLGSDNATIKN